MGRRMEELSDITVMGLGLPDFVAKSIFVAVVIIATLLVQYVLVRAMRKALDNSNIPSASIFINIVRAILWLVALLSLMQPIFGINPTGLVAALGVGSVIISLGLQATVANIMSGLGLMLGKVVEPGDEVSISGFSGVVTDVTWRHTIVRARDGTEQVIPNSVLNTSALTQRTRWDVGDCEVSFVVQTGADLDEVEREVIGRGEAVLGDRLDKSIKSSVTFGEMDAAGITGHAHFHLKDGCAMGEARDRVVRSIAASPWLAGATPAEP